MDFFQSRNMIHFHKLSQKQFNDLLKTTNLLGIDCCYLGHQDIKDDDLLIISSATRFLEIKKIREKYSNWIFLVLENNLNAVEINQFNEIGKIFYINEINQQDLVSRIDIALAMMGQEKKEYSSKGNGQTLAIISHDLKNPLNAIRLDAQILIRNAKKSGDQSMREEVKHFASRIVKTTDRLALMISDLLESDQAGNVLVSLTRTLLNVEELIDEVIDIVSPIAKRNSIKIKKNITDNLPSIIADKNKIFQVLLNLMSNALKFSHQHTSVQISAKLIDEKLHFSVEDSGPGIDPQLDDIIYDRYSSGNLRGCGSGLGLYICKTIIEAHQGSIGHSKGSKGGTIFFFSLPMEMEVRDVNNKKIYLIDDDEDLRDVLSWALNTEGYHVESFSSSGAALEVLKKSSERPALILSDPNTADMQLNEFIDKKKALNLENVPLLLLTAPPSEVSDEVDQRNYSCILSKPIDLDSFTFTISKYMSTTSTQSV